MTKTGEVHLLDDVVVVLIDIVTRGAPERFDFDRDLRAALQAHDEEHETDVLSAVIAETRHAVVWDTSPKHLAREAIAAAYMVPTLGKAGDNVKAALARLRASLS